MAMTILIMSIQSLYLLVLLYDTKIRQETPPGSRLDYAYLIKELHGTCAIAHQCEAPTPFTELLIRWTLFTILGFKPAILGSAA